VALVKIKELEEELPNGFQDAMVSSYTFLEEERRVEIELAVWVGDLWGRDEIGWERYAKARLELLNVLQWEPEAPHPQSYGPLTRSLRIDTYEPEPMKYADLQIPDSAFAGRFYITEWNSFIHFVASDVRLTWLGTN
jgi:hypothetical protein